MPACPVLSPPAFLRTMATAFIEDMPEGLSTTRNPGGRWGCLSVLVIPLHYLTPGQVSERLKERHWKCRVRFFRTVGSNPTLSAFHV